MTPPRGPLHGWFATCLLLPFLFACALAGAETAWSVRVWRTTDGLGGTYVTGVMEDPEGFLWIVSGAELERFDGASFQPFSLGQWISPDLQRIRVFDRRPQGGLVLALQDGSFAQVHDGRVEILA